MEEMPIKHLELQLIRELEKENSNPNIDSQLNTFFTQKEEEWSRKLSQ